MSSLGEILVNAQSNDTNIRQAAFEALQQLKQTNPTQYVLSLSAVLASQSDPKPSRQLAGLNIKNVLSNLNNEEFLDDFWEKVDPSLKTTVRNNVLGTLASDDKDIRLSASQAVAAVAKKDLAKGEWAESIQILVSNAINQNVSYKLASLMTLGYICEGVTAEIIKPDLSNQIFSAIAANITAQDTTNEIKLVALTALSNSLQLASNIMQVNEEREFILNMLYQVAVYQDVEIRKACFQIFCELVDHYYDFLPAHLSEIGNVTLQAIKQDQIEIAILAIEVWNEIGDIECSRQAKQNPSLPVRGFIMTAAPILVPIILENITRGDFEEDDWDLHKSCGLLLSLVAQLTNDKFIDAPIQFIKVNVSSSDWKCKSSACMALGMILEGPSAVKLNGLIMETTPHVLRLMGDENVAVREAAAWALSKISDLQFKVVSSSYFIQILNGAVNSLKDLPKIACSCCWTLIHLIDHSEEKQLFKADIFDPLFQALLESAGRPGVVSSENNLQVASFSTLSTLLEKSANDCIPIIERKLPDLIHMLKHCPYSESNEHMQTLIASSISSALSRVRPESMTDDLCKSFLEALIQSFTVRNSVYEEGIQAIGNFAQLLESRFSGYLQILAPYIAYALQKQDIVGLCMSGTMVIGDIARALGENCKPLINDLVLPLVGNLQNEQASSSVKLRSIESLGDIASNSKEAFVPYVPQVLALIEAAANASLTTIKEEDDPDMYEYLASMRDALLQFYEGFIQGLIAGGQLEVLFPYTPNIARYSLIATQDLFKPNPSMHRTAIGIIGDIAGAYKDKARDFVKISEVMTYIQRFKQSSNSRLREISLWAINLINSI